MSTARKQIAVVGGAGYIGAVTSHLLEKAGFEPVVFDDLSTGRTDNIKGIELIRGDIQEAAAVEDFFANNEFAAVVLLAGLIQVGESMEQPARYFKTNVGGMINVVDAAVRHGVKSIVFSSSAAVYGEPDQVPIKESAALQPINPYGSTKLMGEQLLTSYQYSHQLNWLALRYFNVAGAASGVGDRTLSHLLPSAISSVLAGQPVRIFGDDYDTKDGTCVRDYVHVADIARAHVLAVQLMIDRQPLQRAINLGSDQGMSVGQMADALEKAHGAAIKRQVEPRRAGDPATLLADISIAAEVLGWTPQHDVERIVTDAYTWQKDQS